MVHLVPRGTSGWPPTPPPPWPQWPRMMPLMIQSTSDWKSVLVSFYQRCRDTERERIWLSDRFEYRFVYNWMSVCVHIFLPLPASVFQSICNCVCVFCPVTLPVPLLSLSSVPPRGWRWRRSISNRECLPFLYRITQENCCLIVLKSNPPVISHVRFLVERLIPLSCLYANRIVSSPLPWRVDRQLQNLPTSISSSLIAMLCGKSKV